MSALITAVPNFATTAALPRPRFSHELFSDGHAYADEVLEHLLIIGKSKSICAACGHLAIPEEGRHLSVLDGTGIAGCGTTWLFAANTCDTGWAHAFVTELSLSDAGIVSYDEEFANLAELRQSITLRPATHI